MFGRSRFLLMLLLLTPRLLMALNGIADLGAGVKAHGMGGVGIAYPQDSLAGVANPASLACIGSRWDVGFDLLFSIERSEFVLVGFPTDKRSSSKGLAWPELGLSWEFSRGQVIGIAVAPYGGVSTGETILFGDSTFFYYPLQIVPTWSWRINCAHSIGISIPVTLTWFKLGGANVVVTATSFFPEDVFNRGIELQEGIAVQIGWLGQVNECLAVGATFRTQSWSSKFKKYQGFFPNGGEANLPPSAGLGITWHFLPCWIASAELVHHFWQAVDWLNHNVREPGGSWAEFGSPEGVGFGWSDQTVAKVGLVWDAKPYLQLRAGYNYSRQPVAPSDTDLNQLIQAVVEHHLTVGASCLFWCHEISLFYSYGFPHQVYGNGFLGLPGGTASTNIKNCQQAAGLSVGRVF
jgi:long-chain fatty acid transport protein